MWEFLTPYFFLLISTFQQQFTVKIVVNSLITIMCEPFKFITIERCFCKHCNMHFCSNAFACPSSRSGSFSGRTEFFHMNLVSFIKSSAHEENLCFLREKLSNAFNLVLHNFGLKTVSLSQMAFMFLFFLSSFLSTFYCTFSCLVAV